MSSSFIVEEWRDLWGRKGEFLVTAYAYVFSTTNIFNLPSMIVNYGGGAFLIAYVACILVVCLTILMMELAIGQLSARAPPKALHSACPLFKGVGIALVVYSLFLLSFYAVRAAYLLDYLAQFFILSDVTQDPPWFRCPTAALPAATVAPPESPLTPLIEQSPQISLDVLSGGILSTPCTPLRLLNETKFGDDDFLSINFFHNQTILEKTKDISETGSLALILLAALGAVWFLIFLALFLGVRWLGKVCYTTFFIPLSILLILGIKGLSSTGSDTIMSHMIINTDWDKLLDKTTWAKAFYQSLYATGLCLGSYITLGSYNKRSNNLVGDSFRIIFYHILLTIVQLIFTLSFYGHWLALNHVTEFVPAVIHEGFTWSLSHLLTVASQFSYPQIWSVALIVMLFFMMLNTLYVLTLNICSSMEDIIGDGSSRCLPRFGITLLICVFGFATGIGYTAQAGPYAVELVERYLHLVSPWVILTFELMALGWFYCAHLLARDVRQMLGPSHCWIFGYLTLDLLYLMPAVPVFLLVILLGDYDMYNVLAGFKEEIAEAHWAEPIGWVCAVLPILPIPIYMVYVVTRTCMRGPGVTKWEKFKYTLVSPLRYEVVKPTSPPRYSVTAPGYVLLPQAAPLAEVEQYNESMGAGAPAAYGERMVRVSNI